MAIHPELHSQVHPQGSLSPQQTRAISAWTEQTTASLEDLTISDSVSVPICDENESASRSRPALRGASLPLTIPLDDPTPAPQEERSTQRVRFVTRSGAPKETQQVPSVSFRRREPLRRDSLRRREALQKGKDGSRRRQRWENGTLMRWAKQMELYQPLTHTWIYED